KESVDQPVDHPEQSFDSAEQSFVSAEPSLDNAAQQVGLVGQPVGNTDVPQELPSQSFAEAPIETTSPEVVPPQSMPVQEAHSFPTWPESSATEPPAENHPAESPVIPASELAGDDPTSVTHHGSATMAWSGPEQTSDLEQAQDVGLESDAMSASDFVAPTASDSKLPVWPETQMADSSDVTALDAMSPADDSAMLPDELPLEESDPELPSLAEQLIQDLSDESSRCETELDEPIQATTNFEPGMLDSNFASPEVSDSGFITPQDQHDDAPGMDDAPDMDASSASDNFTVGFDGGSTVTETPSLAEMAMETVPASPDASLLTDDMAIDQVATDEELPSYESPDDRQAATPVGDGDEVDDSIEAYMNRLLQRVQGSDSVAIPQDASPSDLPGPTDAKAAAAVPEAPETPVMPEPEPEPIDPDAPLVPRSQAPEKDRDLSAMRDLANESARGAINRSVMTQTKETTVQAMIKFALAAVASLFGIIAMAMSMASWVKVVALISSLIVAGIFIKEGLSLISITRLRESFAGPSNNNAAAPKE
ncbi:MAG: hypothetical protein AAF539_15400, partial [Planctomycetota bacterium]